MGLLFLSHFPTSFHLRSLIIPLDLEAVLNLINPRILLSEVICSEESLQSENPSIHALP